MNVPEQTDEDRRSERLIAGPAIVLVASLVGLWLCTELTSLKFLIEYQPCLAPKSGCTAISDMDCSHALHSPASTVLGLPISVYGLGFYGLTSTLSLKLMFSAQAFAGMGRIALFVLACCNILVSLFLGVYSVAFLSEMCALCTGLYGVSGVMLIAVVALIERPWTRASQDRMSEATKSVKRVLDGIFFIIYLFVCLTGICALSYQFLAVSADPDDGCVGLPIPPPPPPSVIIGSSDPDILILAFLDPSCGRCQSEYPRLRVLADQGVEQYNVQVHIYQFPRDSAGGCSPDGLAVSNTAAEAHRACWASLAVECVEKLRPGEGAGMLKDLYRYHSYEKFFTKEQIRVAAEHHGVEGEEPFDRNPALACIEEDLEVRERVRQVMTYLTSIDQLLSEDKLHVPYQIIVQVVDGKPDFKHTFPHEGRRLRKELIAAQVALVKRVGKPSKVRPKR